MSNFTIRAQNIGKQYYIGKREQRYGALRDTISEAFIAPFRRASKLMRGQATGAAELDEQIWALKNVSFDVKHGEVVGLIGRNGAGKSTLLKILSRITEPDAGFARIRGRVGSLLEVGTGFHQELTGRENVFLNGAILGMKRTEINRKFDEIVTFSEMEKFIDTPVKHYSSGMAMRLAFAVAAHLEPEILLIDEVLAVGDARFQKKCLNRMQTVGQEGRTVLFVSHNMPAVTRLCERVILLDGGQIIEDGPAHQAVSAYLNDGLDTTAIRKWPDPTTAPGGDVVRLREVSVCNDNNEISASIDIRKPVAIEMLYEVLIPGYVLLPHFHFFNEEGTLVFSSLDQDSAWRRRERPAGCYRSRVWIPGNFLSEGTLFVTPSMVTLNPDIRQFVVSEAVTFQVIDSLEGDSARGDWAGGIGGVVRPLLEWQTEFNANGR